MSNERGRDQGRRRLPLVPALVALACLAVALPALLLLGSGDPAGADGGGGADAVRADGLRAQALPEALAGKPAPRIRLRDARGRLVDTRELRGTPYLVTFLFTECPDVCPLIAQEIRAAIALAGPAGQEVRALAVSVDPRGDTPEAARRFRRRHDLPHNFRYLVGSRGELAPVWEAYFTAPQLPGHPETSTHSASIWLVDGQGRWRAKYSAGIPVAPEDLAHDLRVLAGETPS